MVLLNDDEYRQLDGTSSGNVGDAASSTSGLSWSQLTESSDGAHHQQHQRLYGSSTSGSDHSALLSTNDSSINHHLRPTDRALPKLPSTSHRSSSQSVLDGLSINKLNFHHVRTLHGRQNEVERLKAICDTMLQYHDSKKTKQQQEEQEQQKQHEQEQDEQKRREKSVSSSSDTCKILTLVDGLSGVGKSKLVSSVFKSSDVNNKSTRSSSFFFVTGKFDLKNIHVPFDGIVMAINDLCDQILASYLQHHPQQSSSSSYGTLSSGKNSGTSSLTPTSSPSYNGNNTRRQSNNAIRFGEVQELIRKELRPELPFLVRIFPKLVAVIGEDMSMDGGGGSAAGSVLDLDHSLVIPTANDQTHDNSNSTNAITNTTTDNMKTNSDRLKHCVRRFIQVICSYRPLVVFCDDTQWADDESLDLLYQILTDGSNKNALMVVCAFRSDEGYRNPTERQKEGEQHQSLSSLSSSSKLHPMTVFLQKIKDLDGTNYSIPTHRLTVGNMSVDDLNAFLLDLLDSDGTTTSQKETMDLAVVLHEKTNGNIFFVVQLLLTLHEKGLITYNLGLMKWIWDAQEVKENSPAADNVVELVKNKLEQDKVARQLLPLGACIGSTFDTSILTTVVDGLRETTVNNSGSSTSGGTDQFLSLNFDVDETLKACVREGYIQRNVSTDAVYGYQFVHDRVQEAAFKAVPEHMQSWLKHSVGSILAANLPDDELPVMVFTILGLLDDRIASKSNETPVSYWKLNMLAGEKAMSYSAFRPATEYFGKAVELLPEHSWKNQHSTTYRTYLAAAESEFCLGNFERMNEYCDTVLSRDNVSAIDKLRMSNVVMDSLVAQNKARQSIDIAVSALSACGCEFPKGSFRTGLAAATGLMRTKFSKKMQKSSNIADLPFSSDPAHAAVMKTLDKLATATFVAGASDLFPLVILKSIRWTFDHGMTIYSPAAFALVALLLTNFMDDFGAGWNYARNSLIMLKRLKCREIESRTVFLVYNYTAHWSRPMQDCLKPLQKAYKIGLATGDTMSAMYNVEFYCEIACYTGMQLDLVDNNCVTYGRQMKEFGQMNTLLAFNMVHQMVRILLGRAGENTGEGAVLTGDVMNQAAVLEQLEEAADQLMTAAVHRYRIILACYVGDYETGSQVTLEWVEKSIKLLPGQPTNLVLRFASALCCYAYYRTCGKKKYLKEAKRQHKFLRSWAERSKAHNPNSVHREVLLSAELDAASGRTRSAYTKFESAVLMAGRRGVIHDQALSNERFAAFCSERNDVEEATYRLKSAIALYTEWGAVSKVESLNKSHLMQERVHRTIDVRVS